MKKVTRQPKEKLYRTLIFELFTPIYETKQGKGMHSKPKRIHVDTICNAKFETIRIGGKELEILTPKHVNLSPIEKLDNREETNVKNSLIGANRAFRFFGTETEDRYDDAINFMTVDTNGLKNEEDMYVAEYAIEHGIHMYSKDFLPIRPDINPRNLVRYDLVTLSTSQSRQGKFLMATNIKMEDFINKMTYGCTDIMDNKPKVIAKESARISLCLSTSQVIRDLKFSFAVIEDFKRFVDFKGYVFDAESHEVKKCESLNGEFEMNDGMGVIDIRLAQEIALKMGLSKVPSAFQIRYASCKGLLVVMDIKKYTFGKVTEDILFPESMWKKDFDLSLDPEFAVCQVSKDPSLYANLNYQFIQALPQLEYEKFSENIVKFQLDRLERMTEDPKELKAFLGMLAKYKDTDELGEEVYMEETDIATKLQTALSRNEKVIKESYFQKMIRKLSDVFLDKMAKGKIPCDGSFTILGMDPTCLFEGLRFNDKNLDWNRAGFCDVPYVNDKGEDCIKREYKYTRSGDGKFVVMQGLTSVLKSGQTYYGGQEGEFLGFRPPITHWNQVGKFNTIGVDKLSKHVYENVFKYLGQLIIFNSYDVTHLGMSGANL